MFRRLAILALLFPSVCVLPAQAAGPFYPRAIDTVTGLPASLDDFTPAPRCGYCHPEQYDQWVGSMHAASFRDPFFQGVWREAAAAVGGAEARLCAGCHTPIGTATEQVWIRQTGEIVVHPFAEEGVTCDFCHSVAEVVLLERGGKPGNAGLIVDPAGPKRGPYADAFSTFHETAYSDLHTRSEFCGACHNVFHLASGTEVARTYEEWKVSPYAQNAIECQDCHMVSPEDAAQVAETMDKVVLSGLSSNFMTERMPFYLHAFTGANVAVPSLLSNEKHAGEARRRLRSAAEVELEAQWDPGEKGTLEVQVRVRNRGAGHNLPTGMSEIRQMWLHVTVRETGAGGALLWESGALGARGSLDPVARTFGARAVDSAGNPTWKPWEVTRVVADNSIPPRGRALEVYRIPLPSDLRVPVEVSARLLYRSFAQELAERYLGRPGYQVPVVEMARATVSPPLP